MCTRECVASFHLCNLRVAPKHCKNWKPSAFINYMTIWMVITIYVWYKFFSFVFMIPKKIFVYLASFYFFFLISLSCFVIRQSILHPVSQNHKITWSWDNIGIEYTGSRPDPNFFHTTPQSETPWFYVDTYIFFYQHISHKLFLV